MAEKTKISEATTRDFLQLMQKEYDEPPSGVARARTVRCSNCKQSGHNRRTCQSAVGDVSSNESNKEISLSHIAAGEGPSQKGEDIKKWLNL